MWAGNAAQWVECLPSMHEALDSISSMQVINVLAHAGHLCLQHSGDRGRRIRCSKSFSATQWVLGQSEIYETPILENKTKKHQSNYSLQLKKRGLCQELETRLCRCLYKEGMERKKQRSYEHGRKKVRRMLPLVGRKQ